MLYLFFSGDFVEIPSIPILTIRVCFSKKIVYQLELFVVNVMMGNFVGYLWKFFDMNIFVDGWNVVSFVVEFSLIYFNKISTFWFIKGRFQRSLTYGF